MVSPDFNPGNGFSTNRKEGPTLLSELRQVAKLLRQTTGADLREAEGPNESGSAATDTR